MNVRVVPHKRGKGKWAVDYRCPVTKKRKYESCSTKKEALAKKRKLEGEFATGAYQPLHTMPWTEFIAEYRAKVQIAKKRKTRLLENRSIDLFTKYCDPTSVRSITTKMIDEYAARRSQDSGRGSSARTKSASSVSAYTINKELRVIRTLLRKALQWNYVAVVPQFNLLKTIEPQPRAISPTEFNRILDALPIWSTSLDRRPAGWKKGLAVVRVREVRQRAPETEWWIAFLSVAYLAGLRWGEILNLRWSDIRLTSEPEIRIWNEKCARWDQVPISQTLTDRLQRWMSESEVVSDDKLVFEHKCHARTVAASWRKIQQAAEIREPFRFHDLRVSFCTNLVAAGVEAPLLRKLARHRSIETTMKFYKGRTDLADRRALALMDSAVAIESKD